MGAHPGSGHVRNAGYASTINFANMNNIKDDENRLNINSLDGETPQEKMDRL